MQTIKLKENLKKFNQKWDLDKEFKNNCAQQNALFIIRRYRKKGIFRRL